MGTEVAIVVDVATSIAFTGVASCEFVDIDVNRSITGSWDAVTVVDPMIAGVVKELTITAAVSTKLGIDF